MRVGVAAEDASKTQQTHNRCRESPLSELSQIRACVFDAYGTLFDFASAAARCPGVPQDKRPALTALWRDKQLQYSWLRSLQGAYADFWTVTGDALDFALESFGLAEPGLHAQLMALYLNLDAFPEVGATLAGLKAAGLRLAILSNGSPPMLEALVAHAGLSSTFERVFSVHAVGAFKTDPRVYQCALDELRLQASEVCFCSSNGWDAYAASAFGMKVAWINRYGQRPERLPGSPDLVLKTLAELPARLRSAPAP
jgi:2-haloacid dehalogenase